MNQLWNKVSVELRELMDDASDLHLGAINGYVTVNGELVLVSSDSTSLVNLELDYGEHVRVIARSLGHKGGVRFDVDSERRMEDELVSYDETVNSQQISMFDMAPPVLVAEQSELIDRAAAFRVSAVPTRVGRERDASALRLAEPASDALREAGVQAQMTFNTWFAGDENAVVTVNAKAMASSRDVVDGVLYVYGGSGRGKSHILNAIGYEALREDPNARVRLWSAEEFVNGFVTSLNQKTQADFRRRTRSNVDLFLFDDLGFLEKKMAAQEELASVIRELTRNGCRVVVTGDSLPTEMQDLHERLRSVISNGLMLDVKPMSEASRLLMAKSLVQRAGLRIDEDAAAYVAQTVQASASDVVAAMKRVIAYGMTMAGAISLELVTAQLPQVYKSEASRPTVEFIIASVAEHFRLSEQELLRGGRTKTLAFARQIAMYLARISSEYSYPDLARKFDKKDHTTVMHAVRSVESKLAKSDRQVAESVETLRRRLGI